MHGIYYSVNFGSMIKELSIMVFKNTYAFVKDGMKVILDPYQLEKTPKLDKREESTYSRNLNRRKS